MASDSSEKKIKILAIVIPAAASVIVAVIGLVSQLSPKPAAPIPATATIVSTAPLPSPTVSKPAPTTAAAATAIPPTTSRLSFSVSNQLALPIRVFIDEVDKGTIELTSSKVYILDSFPVKVRWAIVKETTSSGRALGHEMGGAFSGVKAGDKLQITNRVGTQPYFYPLITNNTNRDCEVTINKGWKSEKVTGAIVPARTVDVGLGYYELYSNSNVTLTCNGKDYWWGTQPDEKDPIPFNDVVEAETGLVEFKLDP